MVDRTPSAALEELLSRSTNPVRRIVTATCIVMIQLISLMVLSAEPSLESRRNDPVLGPNSILFRLQSGHDFGLHPWAAAALRALVAELRETFHLGQDYVDRLLSPDYIPPFIIDENGEAQTTPPPQQQPGQGLTMRQRTRPIRTPRQMKQRRRQTSRTAKPITVAPRPAPSAPTQRITRPATSRSANIARQSSRHEIPGPSPPWPKNPATLTRQPTPLSLLHRNKSPALWQHQSNSCHSRP